ncbi:hypothetical protein NM688_g3015 [Phlebia brevispora]|uniref:Uncharacterized protein n=1 Tax=Phlebia brevispora TaxID=194682 RepID=A0ACC1T726_9APHY|nr:hypothetical protein NM688_g3015 [Phlebia brevispora]
MSSSKPSFNWLQLQQVRISLALANSSAHKFCGGSRSSSLNTFKILQETKGAKSSFPRGSETSKASSSSTHIPYSPSDDSPRSLRNLIEGLYTYTDAQKQPGKFLAMDCEMVGLGIDGKESSLARVSVVNYHGAVQMDEFVRQKERVVDYRTEFSGIRPKDLANAKTFEEVQKQVAALVKDRILIGHAINNDLKALLLSHPRPLIRDTQSLAAKHRLTKTRRPALRHLVSQEIGMTIQGGEHSSVIDARATMAIYRIHRKKWEAGMPHLHATQSASATAKRKRVDDEGEDNDEDTSSASRAEAKISKSGSIKETNPMISTVKKKMSHHHLAVKASKGKTGTTSDFPGGGRKGISSGLSTVVKRKETKKSGSWWKSLGDAQKDS